MKYCITISVLFMMSCLQATQIKKIIEDGNLEALKEAVVAKPAIVNQVIEFNDYTPLGLAVNKTKQEITSFLLEKKASVNFKGKKEGLGIIHQLAFADVFHWTRFRDAEIILQKLKEHNVNLNQLTKDGRTPLYIAATGYVWDENSAKYKIKYIDLLIANGAKPKKQLKVADPMLIAVLRRGNKENLFPLKIAEHLIKQGVEVNSVNKVTRDTPLVFLIKQDWIPQDKKIKLIKLLVEKGASIKKKNRKKQSAKTLSEGKPELLQALTKK